MEFCFAKWFAILKNHGLKNGPSNEDLMRDLFYLIREATGSKTKGGDSSWVAKETISAIVNRKESFPKGIKQSLVFYDFDKLQKALVPFYRNNFSKDELSLATREALQSYTTSNNVDESLIYELEFNKNNFEYILTKLLVESAKIENKLYGIKRKVYKNGNSEINYIFGDIIAMSLSSKASFKRGIYVIPVDADFHFHVTKSGEFPPCVSMNTIHGKWIKRLQVLGIKEEELVNKISIPSKREIGSLAVFEINDSLFYLLACSKFDEKNVAHSSKDDIETALINLMKYHDSFGQEDDLYVPLIGTGSSRAKLGIKQSFELIKNTILKNERWHNGQINIVLHISAIEQMEELENVLQD